MSDMIASRPGLLYIIPVLPAPGGGGPQIRAFNNLKVLAVRHRAHLVHCDVFGGDKDAAVHAQTELLCESIIRLQWPWHRHQLLRALRFILGVSPCLLPNAYAPGSPLAVRQTDEEFIFLFIGCFAYDPNHEAVDMLCRAVIGRVNEQSERPVHLIFAGTGASQRLQHLIRNTAFAEYIGPAANMSKLYAGIDAVVVPIHAGGGTRIKILEAFALGRPVVSTPLGVKGIDRGDGVHLLLAENADTFSRQCLRLVNSPSQCQSLPVAAESLLRAKYSQQRIESTLRLDDQQ